MSQKQIPEGTIRIGLSNVQLPGKKTTFPPEYQLKSRLNYYSRIFNTVEVNSCFYKTPQIKTYHRWTDDVPEDFQFTLKLSKQVTHAPSLQDDLSCMNEFLSAATGVRHKKGCLLMQFPGKISLDDFEKVEKILVELERLDPSHEWRVAVEFRNDSWYTGETTELLNEFGVTMVVHDFRKGRNEEHSTNANFIYCRFHGPAGDYRGSYSDEFLLRQSQQIRDWTKEGKDVYAYFNNTAGNAFENALQLARNSSRSFLII